MILAQLQPLATSTQSVAQTTTPSDPISIQTALLVIVAATLLFLVKYLVKLNNRLAHLEGSKGSAARRTPTLTSDDAVAPHVVAAISAAVHTTLRARHRIISVGEICPNRQAWSAEGRRQVFSSHKVR